MTGVFKWFGPQLIVWDFVNFAFRSKEAMKSQKVWIKVCSVCSVRAIKIASSTYKSAGHNLSLILGKSLVDLVRAGERSLI